MALQDTLKTGAGLEFTGYIRVDNMIGGKKGLDLEVNAYNVVNGEQKFVMTLRPELIGGPMDKQHAKTCYSFVPNLDSSKNFLAQAYEYLKTLPRFKLAKTLD